MERRGFGQVGSGGFQFFVVFSVWAFGRVGFRVVGSFRVFGGFRVFEFFFGLGFRVWVSV